MKVDTTHSIYLQQNNQSINYYKLVKLNQPLIMSPVF